MKTELIIGLWGLIFLAYGSFPVNAGKTAESIVIDDGSGSFSIKGGKGHEEKSIRVYYHKPARFNAGSPILIVVPGSGRNGDDYRDAWIEASERYNVLVLSPAYAEKDYDTAAYNFGGTIENLELRNLKYDEHTRTYQINDEDILFDINRTPEQWLFRDFDRLFRFVVRTTGSNQTGYDMFGHSAGGQILQRLAIFYPASRVKRLLASNAGFYTLPRFDIGPPFGLKGTLVTKQNLKRSFASNLVLFLGGLDNKSETRGKHLHTPFVDKQGLGRLERGRNFYSQSRKIAAKLNTSFNWRIKVIAGVGHDYRKMSAAAARFLYGQ